MNRNRLIGAAVASGALCVVCLVIYTHALWVDPLYKSPIPHVAIGGIRISTTSQWGLGGSVLFYNRDLPFMRNITYAPHSGENWQLKGFDWCGLHYNVLVSDVAGTWWSFMFSLWYPIALFSIVPVLYLKRRCGSPD